MRLTRAFSAALVALLAAAGCSGGDGGGGGGGNGGEPPVADAGDDADARLYQAQVLNGSQSADPEGKDLTFSWSLLSAPDGSAATLTSGGAAAMVSFTPDTEGIYLFGLAVSDGKKISTLDTVEVTVELRIAVFADTDGHVARELELAGAGNADDYYGWPSSYIAAVTGEIAIVHDERGREETLIAYHSNDGTQELLVAGEEIGAVRAEGNYVIWRELRGGQYDLFARDLVSGQELQITSDDAFEELQSASAEFVTFTKDNPPYGVDAFMYDFTSHGITNLSDIDTDNEYGVYTDGDTIVYTSDGATQNVWGYDLGSQTFFPIAVSASSNEATFGVSGDFVILSISTGGDSTIYRHRISDSQRTPIANAFGGFITVQGDYAIYRDDTSAAQAFRLSTGTTTLVSASTSSVSLRDGVVAWTEYNGSTNDAMTRVLPAGAVTTIANTGDIAEVAVLANGIAWFSHDGDYVFDVYYSADGGLTTDLASDGKVFLTDRLADYDVAIIGSDIDSSFGTDTIDALLGAGVPILTFDREGSSFLSYYATPYALTQYYDDCGRSALRLSNSTHPAFAGFAAGSYVVIDREGSFDYETISFEVDDLSPPADFVALATYDVASSCSLEGKTAIGTFTTDEGTAVVVDAAATEDLAIWESARRELVLSELRYLASTRAP